MFFPVPSGHCVSRENFQSHKQIFTFNFPCKRALPVILKKLKFSPPIDRFVKFGSMVLERKNIKSFHVFSLFLLLSPLSPSLNKI